MKDKINYILHKNHSSNKENEAVLFLHGWGGSTNSFLYVQNVLNPYYNTLNVDFYGFGKSNEPSVYYDTYLYALSIYELLVELNISTIYIISHSFGGRVAILLSSIFHINVKKLILINSAGLKGGKNVSYYLKVYLYKLCKRLVHKKLLSQKILSHFGSSDYKLLSVEMRQTFVNVVNQDLKQYLPLINSQTLIFWGDKDKVTPISFARILKSSILNSKLIIFKGAGHFSYLDNINEFCQRTIKFLDE